MLSLLAAIATGALFALSLPRYDLAFLAWFSLAPFLIAGIGKRPILATGLAIVAALTAGLVQVGWHRDGHSLFFAYYPFLLTAPILTIVALTSTSARRSMTGLPWTLTVSTLGILCEWLTRFLPMPVHMALPLYRTPLIFQIASITGIWGVSFLVWFSNAANVDIVLTYRQTPPILAAGGPIRKWTFAKPVAVSLGLIAASLGYGAFALGRPASTDPLKVAAIQDYYDDSNADREKMTEAAASKGAQMVVWSEECLGKDFSPSGFRQIISLKHHRPPQPDPTIALAKKLGIYLVTGYMGDEEPKHYNSAALIAPNGRVLGIHHKIHLYAEENRKLRAGTVATAFSTPIGRVGVEICFDTCNTDVTRRIAQAGANIITVPTYDPPVAAGEMHKLHSTLMPFRAVENGVPIVRDDSNGTSEIIDDHGRILAIGPVYKSDIVQASLPLGSGKGTLFTRLGDWFAYLCIFWVVVTFVRIQRSSVRSV